MGGLVTTTRTDGSTTGRQKVGIAEYAVVTDGTVLVTSGLGSCLGIVLYDPETAIAGLLHAMLPSTSEGRGTDPAKFVDAGIEEMIQTMEGNGAHRDRLRAWIVGGSQMLEFTTNEASIGERNVTVAKRLFERYDVPIVGEDVGGNHGRSIKFDPSGPSLTIRTATKATKTL